MKGSYCVSLGELVGESENQTIVPLIPLFNEERVNLQ